jgi:hypothetical protein
MAEKIVVIFDVEESTKNTRRYGELGNTVPGLDAAIGRLYVQKRGLATIGNPRTITVTIEPGVTDEAKEAMKP